MRTYGLGLALLAGALVLVGCEDNPDQFFKVAPKNAGQLWNDGKTAPISDAARNSFNDNFNQSSKDAACAGPVKHATWATMVNQPIIPSSVHGMTMAGLNLAGGDAWTGLKFKDAQAINCQANADGADATTITGSWGDAKEVEATYLINNNTISFMELNQGYTGTLDFGARPTALGSTAPNPFGTAPGGGPHKYSIGIGRPLQRDGVTWTINWADKTARVKQATELFDGLMFTFGKELTSNQTDCVAAQSCLLSIPSDGSSSFGARPLGIYFHIPSITAVQPNASTPDFIYAYYVKLMPFSGASTLLKLDEEGPIATSNGLGNRTPQVNCIQKLGMSYATFLDTCVNVLTDSAGNQATLTKLLGGFAHDKETFDFSVQGVDTDFASSLIGDDKIVADSWTPDPKDTAYHFNMDVRATGTLLNEYSEDGSTFTFGGTGAIYREFARRVQADIHAQMQAWDPTYCTSSTPAGSPAGSCGFEIGDPRCLMAPGDDPKTWAPAKGCTGFEQFVTPGARNTGATDGINRLSVGSLAKGMGFLTALKPGDPISMFCADPSPNFKGADAGASCSTDNDCWSMKCDLPTADPAADPDTAAATAGTCEDVRKTFFKHCGTDDTVGLTGAVFDAPFTRVLHYIGGGDPLRVAPALRDRKYYFQHFGAAITKYLMTAGLSPRPTDINLPQYGLTGTACGGRTCEPNPDHLQFDQVGITGDSATFEYIDRRWADTGKDPLSFEYQILILSGNQQETRFRQHLDRDERAVFEAMGAATGKPLTDEATNVRITNLIGSSVLTNRWMDSSVDGKDAYFCATHVNDTDCLNADPANTAPLLGGTIELDDKGQPLLTDYRGAFTGTPFSLGTSHITLVGGLDGYQPNNEAAHVQIPNFKDPYNLPAGLLPAPGAKILPDWRPYAPGSGFAIPFNGERDTFVPSAAIDLSGQNLSMNLDYTQNPDFSLKIAAAEAQTFEGEIFLCSDPISKDLLHLRQYDSIADVQEWVDRHPGTMDACGIIFRSSGNNTAPVQLIAKDAGITATVGQGSGVGRVVDILFYDTRL